jgi:hypothetical protein
MKRAVPLSGINRMSCWVVPAIAAELWGVTVDYVLSRVRNGSVESRREHGFTFVHATRPHPDARPPGPTPPTFVLVRPTDGFESDEVADAQAEAALDLEWIWQVNDLGAESPGACDAPTAAVEDEELPPLDEEEDDRPLPPRDAFRAKVARQRRPPMGV